MRGKPKLQPEERLVKNATASASVVRDSDDSDDLEDICTVNRIKKAIKCSRIMDCGMNRFSATLKEMDVDQFVLECENLIFEREQYAEK